MTFTPSPTAQAAGPNVYGAEPFVKATPEVQIYDASGAVALNTTLLTVDMAAFGSATIQCVSMGTSGVAQVDYSLDGADWLNGGTHVNQNGSTAVSISAASLVWVPPVARFARLRMSTASTGGTTRFLLWQTTDSLPTLPLLSTGTSYAGDFGVGYRATTTITNAASVVSCMSPATPAASAIKTTAGRLLSFCLQNSSAAVRSVKFFNSATVTLGTTAAVFEVDVPPSGFVDWRLEGGVGFSNSIRFAVTAAKGLTDNTATGLALNDVSGFFAFA